MRDFNSCNQSLVANAAGIQECRSSLARSGPLPPGQMPVCCMLVLPYPQGGYAVQVPEKLLAPRRSATIDCTAPLQLTHFLWHTAAMSVPSFRQQILSCTCQQHCTLLKPTSLRRQHRLSVLQSLPQAVANPELLPAATSDCGVARSRACLRLPHAAQRRHQRLPCRATSFEGGVARPVRAGDDVDADELTPLDGENAQSRSSCRCCTRLEIGHAAALAPCRGGCIPPIPQRVVVAQEWFTAHWKLGLHRAANGSHAAC
jgi:hypothetical protein